MARTESFFMNNVDFAYYYALTVVSADIGLDWIFLSKSTVMKLAFKLITAKRLCKRHTVWTVPMYNKPVISLFSDTSF